MSKEYLFKEFDQVSSKAWKQKIQMDLKGADYNQSLVWESAEGIKVKPFYHSDDFVNSQHYETNPLSKWFIGQTIFVNDAKIANKKALDVLNRGAESIIFTIPAEKIKIDILLSNIDLKSTFLYFNFQFLSADYIKQLRYYVGNQQANIFLNIDIIGNLAKTGNWFYGIEEDHDVLNTIVNENISHPSITTLSVDTALFQNAGADKVQQLAYALSQANEYLNHFKNNFPSENGRFFSICFKVAIGTNYFFEIAKLRALRILWQTLAMEYGINADCHILAIPTRRNKTLYDHNLNMLRTTTECMSAILGGANTVCNLAYDAIYHRDNEFGERIARNQLLILKGESYFDKVDNVADGSYYIEGITQQLAEKALVMFKGIESEGGFLKLLKEHKIQKKISQSAKKEQELFANKEIILVGSNKYQNEQNKMQGEAEIFPFVKIKARKTLLEPIIEKRLAEVLEQKRMAQEK